MGNHIINNKLVFNEDILNLVLQSINYGSIWKNIRSVSKQIYNLSLKYQESKLIELANPILTLIYLYPNEDWDLYDLSRTGAIPLNFINLIYNTVSWNKYIIQTKGLNPNPLISINTNLTIEYILSLDPCNIDWFHASINPGIKVSDMIIHNHLPWNYSIASNNVSIRIEDIINNLELPWNYNNLIWNRALSVKDLSIIINLSENKRWWGNYNTTYEDVAQFLKEHNKDTIRLFPLDKDTLQEYIDTNEVSNFGEINIHSITPKIIKNNPDIDWYYVEIDYSKFTIEELVDITHKAYCDIEYLFNHPDFTIDDFFEYFDINTFGDWYTLSEAHWLTFDIVLKYKDIIPWDHKGLSCNPNVTIDILDNNKFDWIKWDFGYLSGNAQLNLVYILKYSNRLWNTKRLCYNKSLNR